MLLKVLQMKGVRRFEKKGKLAPQYVGPFRISERIGTVSYILELPELLATVHDVFHISMLRNHLRDEVQQQMSKISDLQLQPNISMVVTPVCILAREDKQLRNKVIPLVKVQWSRQGTEEASWEREEDMCRYFPQLFEEEVHRSIS